MKPPMYTITNGTNITIVNAISAIPTNEYVTSGNTFLNLSSDSSTSDCIYSFTFPSLLIILFAFLLLPFEIPLV